MAKIGGTADAATMNEVTVCMFVAVTMSEATVDLDPWLAVFP